MSETCLELDRLRNMLENMRREAGREMEKSVSPDLYQYWFLKKKVIEDLINEVEDMFKKS